LVDAEGERARVVDGTARGVAGIETHRAVCARCGALGPVSLSATWARELVVEDHGWSYGRKADGEDDFGVVLCPPCAADTVPDPAVQRVRS
jgi:hypothetical protein